ncbi:MAG: glutathione S-transferase family protein [Legionellales bacterium]|nr:glutathione S-transferase family protein [Legionellales bacterium]
MLKIIGTHTSPFTRSCRVVCEELAIPYEYSVIHPFGKLTQKDVEFIGSHNPLIKVPILIDGNTEIIDSRIIIKYLLEQPVKTIAHSDFRRNFPTDFHEENLLTIILGINDAGILRFMLKATHPEINQDEGYMQRCLERIGSGLSWLEKQPTLGQSFGIPEIALISCLEWFKKRHIFDWETLDRITTIYKKYCDRASLIKTRIPDSV